MFLLYRGKEYVELIAQVIHLSEGETHSLIDIPFTTAVPKNRSMEHELTVDNIHLFNGMVGGGMFL